MVPITKEKSYIKYTKKKTEKHWKKLNNHNKHFYLFLSMCRTHIVFMIS